MEIVTIWNLACGWQTRNVQPTLRCQTSCYITEETLVIAHIHNRGHHNLGVNFSLAELRQKYWIVNGREEIKQLEREMKCNACKLGGKHRGQQIMALLPEARLGTSLRCFAHCGVDFAGRFVVKLTRKATAKRYLCLFTCASTRAVHLEVAYSLETASFLNAFSRWSRDVETRSYD